MGGANRWKYDSFVNWEFFPSVDLPILVYFKETQTPQDQWDVGPGQWANGADALAKDVADFDKAPKVLRLLGDLPTLDGHKKDRKPKKKELKAFLDLDLDVPVAQMHMKGGAQSEQSALGYLQGADGPLSPTNLK